MAEAIISGIKKTNLACNITVSDPVKSRRTHLLETYQVNVEKNNVIALQKADLIILSVKPQSFKELSSEISDMLSDNQTILSIMAGINLHNISMNLNHDKIVRVMPNTPAQVGKGVAVWTTTDSVDSEMLKFIKGVFQSCGIETQVNEEKYIDIATAISGSGPAYVFMFIEALIDAGVNLGLESDLAKKLSIETVLGSAHLASNSTKQPNELRRMVTSPGGTTESGLKTLESNGFKTSIDRAVNSAFNRGIELSKEVK